MQESSDKIAKTYYIYTALVAFGLHFNAFYCEFSILKGGWKFISL